jgi:hypothetical protein
MSKASTLINTFESTNPQNLKAGDEIKFLKDNFWKMSGDTFGWKKVQLSKLDI